MRIAVSAICTAAWTQILTSADGVFEAGVGDGRSRWRSSSRRCER